MPPKKAFVSDAEDPRIAVGVRALRDAGLELPRLEMVQLLIACDYNPTVAAVVAIQSRAAAAAQVTTHTTEPTTLSDRPSVHADPAAALSAAEVEAEATFDVDDHGEGEMLEWRFESNGGGGGSGSGGPIGSRSVDYAEFQQQQDQAAAGVGHSSIHEHAPTNGGATTAAATSKMPGPAREAGEMFQQRAGSASYVDQPLQQQKYRRSSRRVAAAPPAATGGGVAAMDDDEDANMAQWLQRDDDDASAAAAAAPRRSDGVLDDRNRVVAAAFGRNASDDDDDDDGHRGGDDERHVGYATAAAGFAGIFMTSMVHGGFHQRPGATAAAAEGEGGAVAEEGPRYTWLNEGICIVRLDDDRQATHTTTIELVDLASLSREDFEARLASWRDDDYTDLAADLGDAMDAPEGFSMEDEVRRINELRTAHQRRALLRRREETYAAVFEKAIQNGKDVLAAMEAVDKLRAKDEAADLALAGVTARSKKKKSDDDDTDSDAEPPTGAASVKPKKTVKVVESSSSDYDDGDENLTALEKMRRKAAALKRKEAAEEKKRIDLERREQLMQRRNARKSTYGNATAEMLESTYKIRMRLPTQCKVAAIRHIDNTALKRRFDSFCTALSKAGTSPNVQLAFHGTSNEAVAAIAETGFIAPLENARLQHSSGNDGWYGNGIYLAPDPNTSYWYARGDRMLVCIVAMGKIYRCPGMMMGAHLQSGYTSHTSPGGDELVAYASAQVLPIAIIIFDRQQAVPSFMPAAPVATVTSKFTREELDLKRLKGAAFHVSNSVRKGINRENREAWRARKK